MGAKLVNVGDEGTESHDGAERWLGDKLRGIRAVEHYAEADAVEQAVADVLASDVRTADIASPSGVPSAVSTSEMGDAIQAALSGF